MPWSPESEPGAIGQRSADRLAVALEEVGFDVGQEFPALRGGVDAAGRPMVDIGHVSATDAFRLAGLLARAAERGLTVSGA